MKLLHILYLAFLLVVMTPGLISAEESRELKKSGKSPKSPKSPKSKKSKKDKKDKKSKKSKKSKKDKKYKSSKAPKKSKKGKKGKKGELVTEAPILSAFDDDKPGSEVGGFGPSDFEGDDDGFGASSADDDDFAVFAADDDEAGFCEDSRSFTFTTEYDGRQDCEWISKKTSRQEDYCNTKGWNGRADRKVKFFCRESCADYHDLGCKDRNENNCRDDPDFMFRTDNAGKQDCEWVDEKENRQEKWCNTHGADDREDEKVKFSCRSACSEYHNLSCKRDESRPDKCRDSRSFEFRTDNAGRQDCQWISARRSRQEEYCNTRGSDGRADGKVKNYCRQSCSRYNNYDCDNESDGGSGDGKPNINCNDRGWFEFRTDNSGRQDCDWLSAKDNRQDKYCNTKGSDGNEDYKVKFYCQDACSDFLDDCGGGDGSDRPNVNCNDRNSFTFRANGGNRDCDWLDVRQSRRDEYCNSKGENGRSEHKVKFHCQDTCRNFLSDCKNSGDNRCVDRSNYTFMTDNAGRQDCDWLSAKENRQEKWCNTRGSDGRSDRKVKYNCQESCSRYNDC